MDNRRNSGSYSARLPNSSLQPQPDSYTQKRTSYRRPIDPQPAPVPVSAQAPPTNNAVPSNSVRPVAAGAPPNGVSRSSSHRRRQSQQIPPPSSGAGAEPLPAAPDVPRGPPPTSYRDPYAPKGSSRSHGGSRPYSGRSRDPTIQMTSRQQPNIQIAPDRLQDLRVAPLISPPPQSGNIDGLARRPSVPDRSPLQKLEGKLDDISKEEKRARMLELELAAQDKKARMLELELAAQEKAEAEMRARRAREAAAKQQRVVSGPMPGQELTGSAPGRTANSRRHVSMPVHTKPRSPQVAKLDDSEDDGMLYDLTEPWDPSNAVAPGSQPQSRGMVPSASQRQKHRLSHVDGTVDRTPSVKGKEPVGLNRGTGSFRDRAGATRSLEPTSQIPQSVRRKPVVEPTGLGLSGVEDDPHSASRTGADVNSYESKRLTKDIPPIPKSAISDSERKRDSRGIMAAQMEMERQRLDHKSGTKGMASHQPYDPPVPTPAASVPRHGVGFAPSLTEPDPSSSQESHDDHHHPDVFSHNEPDRRYVPTPMLQEWKSAPIAALALEDLDLDAPERSDAGKKAWWEESTTSRRRRSGGYAQTAYDGYADEPSGQTSFNPPLYLKCGPLLRYTGLRRDKSKPGKAREIWRGSVMIVTVDEQSSYQRPPTLKLFKQPMDLLPPPPAEIDAEGQPLNPAYVDPIEGLTKMSRSGKTLYVKPIDEIAENEDLSRVEDDSGLFQQAPVASSLNGNHPKKSSRLRRKDGEKLGKVREVPGVRLHAERGVTFWRFNLEIELGSTQARIAYKINQGPATGFWVPARGETMNIMFHSCNGFSLSVNSKEFCGPDPMWRDVLNSHQTRPFHVMIGGGDQIYNDAAMRDTTLFRQWTESRNPLQKHSASFSSELQNELEEFYLNRYAMWFSQGLFGMANSQIPMINIWDDHDIIDGFGSYPHHFMSTPVFTGLGAVAFKYYMLFQHQSVSAETDKTEPSWILGTHPGPYIKEQSRSVFMHLGRQVAFLGLDARTERQRDEVITEDTYDVIFDRLEDEIVKGETKHLLVLLGVPIAYPRLNFLENILTSRLMDPIKALGRTGLLGNFVNKFDGGVEILDDLDDHWTAKHHKEERGWFIRELQHIASTKSVRVTILAGDVHLAAVGQFYTNQKVEKVAKDKDHRYMPNVISSAIVNTPPPDMMADIINKRNKVHHLDDQTDEDMIPLFTHDVDGKKRNNTHLLPRRNWCSLREYKPGTTPPATPSPPNSPGPEGPRLSRTFSDSAPGKMIRRMSGGGRGRASGPPMSYYNNPAYAAADEERAGVQSSFSPEREQRPRSRRNSLTSLFRRRASVDSVNTPGSTQSLPAHQNRNSFSRNGSVSVERPSPFHRRPSMRSKKGASLEGNYINLENGLDICLNLEVSQKDPAGITTPYRLLVPALNYTAPPAGAVVKEHRKSRIGSMFGVFGGGARKRRTVGDDGYSHSGNSDNESERSDEIGEVGAGAADIDEEERTRQRYKVGPRILMPSFSSKKRNSVSADYANASHGGAAERDLGLETRRMSTSHDRPSVKQGTYLNYSTTAGNTEATRRDRHVSAPSSASYNATPALSTPPPVPTEPRPQAAQTLPSRSGSTRQPTHNSSHKSQLPALEPEPKVHRRSMGGILNQHRGPGFEHDAHVAAHVPSASSSHNKSKRESYPPHPAIVGAGPGSPYSRTGVEPRPDNDGGYFASGGRSGAGNGIDSRSAGVGAKYLGRGRYEDEEDYSDVDGDGYSDGRSEREGRVSQDSFVPPKSKPRWKIWK